MFDSARVVATASPVTAAAPDKFGFQRTVLVLSRFGLLYAIPIDRRGEEADVVADVAWSVLEHVKQSHGRIEYHHMNVLDQGQSVAILASHDTYVWCAVTVDLDKKQVAAVYTLGEHLEAVTENFGIDENLLVKPEGVQAPRNIHLYVTDKVKGTVTGYRINPSARQAMRAWNISLGSPIAALAAPREHLQIFSADSIRIFPNGTSKNEVRRKYPTANIVATAHYIQSDEDDDGGKVQTLVITVLDSVTGSVLGTVERDGAHGPVHVLIVEHTVIFHYFDSMNLRYCLGVIELFEQEDSVVLDSTPTTPGQIISSLIFTAQKTFSSYTSRPPVLSFHVLAIGGGAINAMGVTTSYQGISRKQIIFAFASGRVQAVELRTVLHGFTLPQKPDAVLTLVPLQSVNIISHRLLVRNAEIVETSPTELESSTHIVVAGIDLFYNRLSSGKAFDVLNEDFNREWLLLLVGAFMVATVVLRFLVQRKKLRETWDIMLTL